MIHREGWGALTPTGGFTPHTINQLTIHHTAVVLAANREAPAKFRQHQRFHQSDRGWSDIAYHFLIDATGNVYAGRPIDAVGDTGTNYDPTGHFLVACEGDFNRQPVPDAQLESMTALLGWATARFELGPTPIINGHRDVATTSCPGDDLYRFITDGTISTMVAAHVATPIELELLDPETSATLVATIEA